MRHGIAVLCVVAVWGGTVPLTAAPASAATSPFSATVVDRRGDAKARGGDIRRSTVEYGQRNITFTVKPGRMHSLRSYRWRVGRTLLMWLIDTTGDLEEDYVGYLYHNGSMVDARIESPNGTLICGVRARATKQGYRLRVPRHCLLTPKAVRFQTLFLYDTNPKDPNVDRAQSWDISPDGKFSRWARRPPLPTTLQTYASTGTVEPGASVTFSGRIGRSSDVDTPYGGRTVEVLRRPHRASAFEQVATITTGDYDAFTWTDTPEASAVYKFRFPGSADLAPSTSAAFSVGIVRDVSSAMSHDDVPLGETATLSGTVSAAGSGHRVTLQRRISYTRWADVTSTTTTMNLAGGESTFEFDITPSRSGAFEYRAVAAGDDVFIDTASWPHALRVIRVTIDEVAAGDGPVADAQDPNREYVTITNTGAAPVSTFGWMLEVNGAQRLRVPDTTIVPGLRVRLHTGTGNNSSTNLYLNQATPLWQEEGGIARVFTRYDMLAAEHRYGAASGPAIQ